MRLGLSEEESKYYVFILIMGPIPIRTIVRRYNNNRVRVYRALQKLVEKGFLEKIMGRPVLYTAKPLDDILKNSIENLQKKLFELETTREDTLSEWKKISEGVEKPSEEPRFRIHQGRQQVYNLLITMCEKAEEEVLFISTENDLHRLSLYGFDDGLRKISEKGIQFNFMTQIKSLDFEEIFDYYNFTTIRHIPLPSPVRIIIIDNSEVLVTVQMDDSMNMTTQIDTGLWTNAQSFISVMSIFFNALWKLASDAPSVLYEMKTGTKIQEIITLRSGEEFLDYASKSIEKCSSSLDLIVSNYDNILFNMIKDVQKPEIKTRIVTHLSLNNIDLYDDLTDYSQIRHNSTLSEMYLLIFDKTELFVKLPSWQKKTQSVWSNNIHYVESMQHLFDDTWERSKSMNEIMSRLQSEEKSLQIMRHINSTLSDNEYIVESPGVIEGASSTQHVFSLVARKKRAPETLIGFDILNKKEQSSQISLLGAKRTDLSKMKIVLISNITPTQQVIELAKLFRIQIFDENEILNKINNIIKQKE